MKELDMTTNRLLHDDIMKMDTKTLLQIFRYLKNCNYNKDYDTCRRYNHDTQWTGYFGWTRGVEEVIRKLTTIASIRTSIPETDIYLFLDKHIANHKHIDNHNHKEVFNGEKEEGCEESDQKSNKEKDGKESGQKSNKKER